MSKFVLAILLLLVSACASVKQQVNSPIVIENDNSLEQVATHYFELTILPETYPAIVNVHLDAIEHDNGIVFLHAVKAGPANQSYGLQVAQLAGIPRAVIEKAREKLQQLENDAPAQATTAASPFPSSPAPAAQAGSPFQSEMFATVPHPAVDFLQRLEVDEITAKEALKILYELKQKADS